MTKLRFGRCPGPGLEGVQGYASNDILVVDQNDLHSYERTLFKYAIGYKFEYSPQLNLKAQVEYYDNQMGHHDATENKFEFKVQLSYGL